MAGIQFGEFESELVADIYEAALNQELWKRVLQKLRDTIEAAECAIYFYDAQCRSRNYAAAATADNDIAMLYLKKYIDHEASIINQNFQSIPTGTIIIPSAMKALTGKKYAQIIGDAYFEEFKTKHDLYAGSILIHGRVISAAMGAHCWNGSPEFSPEVITFLNKVAAHMSQAMHIHNQITGVEQINQGLRDTLNRIGLAVFLLDDTARILFSNNEAARILESSSALKIVWGGRLALINEQQNSRFQILTAELVESGIKSKKIVEQGLSLIGTDTAYANPLKITLIPVRNLELGNENICLVALVNDPNRPYIVPNAYLKQSYGLTSTECVIAQSLLKGLSISEIATNRNTSTETARGQLKILMSKTNTHSQTELSRLLMALSDDFS